MNWALRAETDKVHVHDLHATILHLLGLDHAAPDLSICGPISG